MSEATKYKWAWYVQYLFFIIFSSFGCLVLFNLYEYQLHHESKHTVILISMDGFRHDYIEKAKSFNFSLPNFDYMIRNGVRAKEVKNAFPTITLPNHHTLVTGMFPESHGIVLNNFIDPKYPKLTFEMDNQDTLNQEFWFNDMPEPIWVTLQKQKNKLAGSMLWPITDAKFHGDLPFQQVSQFTLLDGLPARYPYYKRVQEVMWWLTNPRYHLDLVLMYYDEPDETGHGYGPNSLQVAKKVKELDGSMGELLSQIRANGLEHSVDIILTADHGMAQLSSERVIEMDKYVDPNLYTYTLLTPVGAIYPYNMSNLNYIYKKLKHAHPKLSVYLKGEVPAHLNYNNNIRIAPLILVASNGWSIIHNATAYPPSKGGGNHGYDNNEPDMHPFLLAMGDSFRKNLLVDLLHSVDVYPLMCHLLQLKCPSRNGTLSRISEILVTKNSTVSGVVRQLYGMVLYYMILMLIWALILIIIIFWGCPKAYRNLQYSTLTVEHEIIVNTKRENV